MSGTYVGRYLRYIMYKGALEWCLRKLEWLTFELERQNI